MSACSCVVKAYFTTNIKPRVLVISNTLIYLTFNVAIIWSQVQNVKDRVNVLIYNQNQTKIINHENYIININITNYF